MTMTHRAPVLPGHERGAEKSRGTEQQEALDEGLTVQSVFLEK